MASVALGRALRRASGAAMSRSVASKHSHRTSSSKASKGKRDGRSRADHRCSMCGVHGMDSNEFKDRSRFAAFPYIIFSKGTDDEPAGDCVTCDTVWDIGGYASEFGTQENFKAERDRGIGLTQAWKKSCALWLEAHNAGRRCRARSDKTKKRRGGSNFIDQVQDIRKIRKRIVKEKSRNFKVKVPLKIYTPSATRWCTRGPSRRQGSRPRGTARPTALSGECSPGRSRLVSTMPWTSSATVSARRRSSTLATRRFARTSSR